MNERARALIAHAVFIGGVPRSGTTFLARGMNSHPDFVVSADDHVLESWALYYYRGRSGIVADLRRGKDVDVAASLERSLFAGGSLLRVVPSGKVASFPPSAPPRPPEAAGGEVEAGPVRHDVPLASVPASWRLCLKSPEITYVLDDLAALLPSARFLMVYRPLHEVADSMYRMGEKVRRVRIFHRRWREEKDGEGRLVPPPGVPPEWGEIWHDVTDYQRCVINGASYLKALVERSRLLPARRLFFVDHRNLRDDPERLFSSLARFLGVEESGFREATGQVVRKAPALASSFASEYAAMVERLSVDKLTETLGVLSVRDLK